MTQDRNSILEPRWFVAHTQPNAEAKAAAHLMRQGFGVYVPRYLKRRRHARKIDIVAAPLFPRYLFVAVDLNAQRWRSIWSAVSSGSSWSRRRATPRGDDEITFGVGVGIGSVRYLKG